MDRLNTDYFQDAQFEIMRHQSNKFEDHVRSDCNEKRVVDLFTTLSTSTDNLRYLKYLKLKLRYFNFETCWSISC